MRDGLLLIRSEGAEPVISLLYQAKIHEWWFPVFKNQPDPVACASVICEVPGAERGPVNALCPCQGKCHQTTLSHAWVRNDGSPPDPYSLEQSPLVDRPAFVPPPPFLSAPT